MHEVSVLQLQYTICIYTTFAWDFKGTALVFIMHISLNGRDCLQAISGNLWPINASNTLYAPNIIIIIIAILKIIIANNNFCLKIIIKN